MLPFVLICGLGAVAAVLFHLRADLQRNVIVLGVYFALFASGCLWFVCSVGASISGPVGAIFALFTVIVGLGFALAMNAVSLWSFADCVIDIVMKTASGDIHIKVKRTYDRAEAAQARHDYETALSLYRKVLEDDPKDREAHRRIGELCLTMGRTEEATEALRRVIAASETENEWCAGVLRLAEVLGEELGRPGEARDLYESIIKRYPRGRHAGYACSRMAHGNGGPGPPDAATGGEGPE